MPAARLDDVADMPESRLDPPTDEQVDHEEEENSDAASSSPEYPVPLPAFPGASFLLDRTKTSPVRAF